MSIFEIPKLIAGLRLLWQRATANKVYFLQLVGAAILVIVNYVAGPFLPDSTIMAIGAALVVPEFLWKLLITAAKKLAEFVRERKE